MVLTDKIRLRGECITDFIYRMPASITKSFLISCRFIASSEYKPKSSSGNITLQERVRFLQASYAVEIPKTKKYVPKVAKDIEQKPNEAIQAQATYSLSLERVEELLGDEWVYLH